jgi:hypothetical protein
MDTQRSNPDQQSDKQRDRSTPGAQQQEEGVGKKRDNSGSQQGGQQPERGAEHKSREGQNR